MSTAFLPRRRFTAEMVRYRLRSRENQRFGSKRNDFRPAGKARNNGTSGICGPNGLGQGEKCVWGLRSGSADGGRPIRRPRTDPLEMQGEMPQRRRAYACEITCAATRKSGFDLLHDRLLLRRIEPLHFRRHRRLVHFERQLKKAQLQTGRSPRADVPACCNGRLLAANGKGTGTPTRRQTPPAT